MKKILFTLFAAVFLLSAQENTAHAGTGASDIIKEILSKAGSLTSKSKWKDTLCKKGNLFGLKFSLRSASGVGCKSTHLGGFALALCSGYGDFDGSSCDKNARKIHGDNPNIPTILTDIVKKDAKSVGKIACMAATFVPEIGAVINIACEGAGL